MITTSAVARSSSRAALPGGAMTDRLPWPKNAHHSEPSGAPCPGRERRQVAQDVAVGGLGDDDVGPEARPHPSRVGAGEAGQLERPGARPTGRRSRRPHPIVAGDEPERRRPVEVRAAEREVRGRPR